MNDQSNQPSSRIVTSLAITGTTIMAGASFVLTAQTMRVYGVWDDGMSGLLMLAPCLVAFGLLAGFVICEASRRAQLSLVTATAVLSAMTFGSYLPELAHGPGGCMSGLIVLASVPISIGFLLVLGLGWLLYGYVGRNFKGS